jgi:hypothetical protein
MKKILLTSLIGFSFIAMAEDNILPSNLKSEYPSNQCIKPVEPVIPERPETVNEESIAEYNKKVDVYNAELTQYNTLYNKYFICVETYIKGVENDLNIIEKKGMKEVLK